MTVELAPGTGAHELGGPALLVREGRDRLGMVHRRYALVREGRPVVNGELIVHVGSDGQVVSVTGGAVGEAPASPAVIGADAAAAIATSTPHPDPRPARGERGTVHEPSPVSLRALDVRRRHVLSSDDGMVYAAWQVRVVGAGSDGLPIDDRVYVDVVSGRIVERLPAVHAMLDRRVHDARGQVVTGGNQPPGGPLLVSESAPHTDDPLALHAFENLGASYNCLRDVFGRDSFDGRGSPQVAFVHAAFLRDGASTGGNAMWYAGTIWFGDGEPGRFGPLSTAFDVSTHEMTHGVIEHTAGLVFRGESGAINESLADIFAAVCEAHRDGETSADTWRIAEAVWTPDRPGDALRYLDDPAADDGSGRPLTSRDYYPHRYTGSEDSGGVHYNSGISSLAFYLLSEGGRHPRGKTEIEVPALGIERAAQVFWRAHARYMVPTTGFYGARSATEAAASDLYGDLVAGAVGAAWAAFGVGDEPSLDRDPPEVSLQSPPADAVLQGAFAITAEVTDASPIAVEFVVDGEVVAEAGDGPYRHRVDGLAPGLHTVGVRAGDGLHTAGAVVTIEVVAAEGAGPDDAADRADGATGPNDDGGDDRDDGGEGGCAAAGGTQACAGWLLAVLCLAVLRRRDPRP